MMIMTAILGIGFIFALAGDFVLWAKLDEYKRMAQDEHANYIAALNLHNATAEAAQSIDDYLEKQLDCAAGAYEDVTGMYRTMSAYSDIVKQERDALQDRLSALLCPTSNHVWKDGRCVKCGRVQE